MYKLLLVIPIFIVLFASTDGALSTTIKPPDKDSTNCASNNFRYRENKIIDINYCENSTNFIFQQLSDILNQSPNYFTVVLRMDVKDDNFEINLKSVLEKKLSRPIILYVYGSSAENDHTCVIDKSNSSNYAQDFVNKVMSYNFSLTDSELMEINGNYSNTLKNAINNNCSICIRFAQLMDERFAKNLKIDDLSCDASCFKALLNLPENFNFDDECDQIYKSIFKSFIDSIRESSEAAAKISENYTVNDFLDDKKVELPLNWITELAWKVADYQIFEFLIRNDFQYPDNFIHSNLSDDLVNNEYIKNLKKYIVELENFHLDILDGKLEEVEKFTNNHPNLVFARNLNNKSALKAAFDNNKIEIFAYLKSKGMDFGSFEELADYYKTLNESPQTDRKKVQIFQFNRRFLTSAVESDLITKILKKSRYIYDHRINNEDEIYEILVEIYGKINETFPELLNIVANSNKLEIIFDFINSNIIDIDPSDDYLGISNYYYNYIIIAALDLLSQDIIKYNYALATVGHEMMHRAMYQIYWNDGMPYDEYDKEKSQIMMNIRNKYEKLDYQEPVIVSAYESYEKGEIIDELIARIPDIILTYRYNQTHVDFLKTTFSDLFLFYNNYVLPDMRDYILSINVREKVREINNWLDLVPQIKNYNEYEDRIGKNVINKFLIQQYLNGDDEQKIKNFATPNSMVVLKKLYYMLRKSKTIAIYMPSWFIINNNFYQVMSEINSFPGNVSLIVYCDQEQLSSDYEKILQDTTFRHIAVIMEESEPEYMWNFIFAFFFAISFIGIYECIKKLLQKIKKLACSPNKLGALKNPFKKKASEENGLFKVLKE